MYVGHWSLWHGFHDAIKGNEMLHMENTEDFHIFLYNIILKFLHWIIPSKIVLKLMTFIFKMSTLKLALIIIICSML